MTGDYPRKPKIYLLVILPVLAGGGMALILGLIHAYAYFRNVSLSSIPDRNALLIALPALFLWIPLGLIISNFIIYIIPPFRRFAEDYVARTNRPGFVESQMVLIKVFGASALVCLPLMILGYIS
jgi:hypothetical protein